MAVPVLMPQPGNTVEECVLLSWKKQKGDTVAEHDIIAEIETDKAAFDVEAPASGVLLETFFQKGAVVPVLVAIGVIGKKGENAEEFRPKVTEKKKDAAPKAAAAPAAGTAAVATVAASQPEAAAPTSASSTLSPRARQYLQRRALSRPVARGSGVAGRITEKDVREQNLASPRISPVAADLVSQGWRLPATGTGPAGLIRAEDLLPPGKPLTGVRALIANRMVESLLNTAQYTVSMQADATGLVALRKKLKNTPQTAEINVNDLVMFAAIVTLKNFPDLNATLVDNTVFPQTDIHLGFACDTPRGLMVPVIKKCQNLSPIELARETRNLSKKAQAGTLPPDDMTGGTFTVSNLGRYGVRSFTPVLNTPQVAILGVCAISLEPVRQDDDKVVFIDSIGLSLTVDHQTVDGVMAARFLQALAQTIATIQNLFPEIK
jgi:pyruvate dehydrogenase E2 component (dihydrolipoamide acetyltransferase)